MTSKISPHCLTEASRWNSPRSIIYLWTSQIITALPSQTTLIVYTWIQPLIWAVCTRLLNLTAISAQRRELLTIICLACSRPWCTISRGCATFRCLRGSQTNCQASFKCTRLRLATTWLSTIYRAKHSRCQVLLELLYINLASQCFRMSTNSQRILRVL